MESWFCVLSLKYDTIIDHKSPYFDIGKTILMSGLFFG